MTGPLKGRLLVATPMLRDPNFARTVVLMLEHTDEGAVGLVLNRPSDADVTGSVPGWDAYARQPQVFFHGGPVSEAGVIALARIATPTPAADDPVLGAWVPVLGPIGTVDLTRDATDVAGSVEEIRLFAGYAGWGPGQVETEIGERAWFVLDAEPDDALCRRPGGLWRAVLRRQPGRLALLASYPGDLATN